ncbi:DUF4142 domain-containing protein [Phenylobacterium sp.]|uniref:DUF4142 domain-containing protein n=1 Tax=Phenylobacterium sp. TaxID=1871053 RepID=UPI0035B116BF
MPLSMITLRRLSIPAALLALAACSGDRAERARAMAEAQAAKSEVRDVVTVAPPAPAPPPEAFVAAAASGDAFEIASGRLGATRAQDTRVRGFAAMLVADHTTSAAKLRKAVAESGRTLSAPDGVAGRQQAALTELSSATADFDRRFMEAQVRAHEEALALLQGYAEDGDVTSLRAFAAEAAGVVRHHLELARSLLEQLR